MLKKKSSYVVAVAGATGAVGKEMIEILEERNFPVRAGAAGIGAIRRGTGLFATELVVKKLSKDSFKGVDIALFSAGAERSLEFAPSAVTSGAVVIDNSNAFRMAPGVPLVVPEINAHAVVGHAGIIANPNCSTIGMVMCSSRSMMRSGSSALWSRPFSPFPGPERRPSMSWQARPWHY